MWVDSHSPGGDTVDHLRHATPYLATAETKIIMGTNLCLEYSKGHIYESIDLQSTDLHNIILGFCHFFRR